MEAELLVPRYQPYGGPRWVCFLPQGVLWGERRLQRWSLVLTGFKVRCGEGSPLSAALHSLIPPSPKPLLLFLSPFVDNSPGGWCWRVMLRGLGVSKGPILSSRIPPKCWLLLTVLC